MKSVVLRIVCVLAGFALYAADAPAQVARPGDDFLVLVDAKKYAESWDIASDYLKQSVPRTEWAAQMARTRDPLGDLATRTFRSETPQTDPRGAPPGEYDLVTYETVFASQGAPRTETLALVKVDGRWRVVGYFVR